MVIQLKNYLDYFKSMDIFTVIAVTILFFFWINRVNHNTPTWVRYVGWGLFIVVIISRAF